MIKNHEYWIEKLNLKIHPEGGFYSETYRSGEFIQHQALDKRYSGDRSMSTSIYFMITKDSSSKFHKIKSDEIWYYHTGGSLKIDIIKQDGTYMQLILGCNPDLNENLQVVIPHGSWFAASINDGDYVLISCGVAPGFDFELADRNTLLSQFPEHEKIIISNTL
jgi:predicted cupin superfamily sugar epimerase